MKNTILAATFLVASTFAGAAFAAENNSSVHQSYGPYVGSMNKDDSDCGHKGQKACTFGDLRTGSDNAGPYAAQN